MEWEKLGYILASKYRQEIILTLAEGEKTPKEIAKETGFYLSHVSSTLSELETEGFVACLTPKLRRGKLFGLTEIGWKIAREIQKRYKKEK